VYASNVITNSGTATVTVIADTNPPVVLGASAFPGSTQIGLNFNKDLDTASAGNAANYKVNGAAVISATVRTNVANELTVENNLVSLIVANPITNSFTVAISGVKDTWGNVATNVASGQ
jgi:hypothetical protein